MRPASNFSRLLVRLGAAVARGRVAGVRAALVAARGGGISRRAAYEAVLQTYLFAGFPRALNALSAWAAVFGPHQCGLAERLGARHRSRPGLVRAWRSRGETLCRRIYGESYGRLRSRISSFSPEMSEWMLIEGYGKTLSRPGLDLRNRDLAILGALAVLDVPAQLESHLRGALRIGVTPALLRRLPGWLAGLATVAQRLALGRMIRDALKGGFGGSASGGRQAALNPLRTTAHR